ncbi:TIR domain-containing protein [Mycobacterium sp. SMC-17]|uniref:TIR domain-containing protein n=1 Tax=Mycobacterium sp. SMC-17 TaxID=3381628 RepID=UPI003876F70C
MKLTTAKKLILLDEQIHDARGGEPTDFNEWKAKTGVILRRTVGEADPLVVKFEKIKYTLGFWTDRTTQAEFNAAKRRGVLQGVALLEAAKTQLEVIDDLAEGEHESVIRQDDAVTDKSEIFIVHGRDDGAKAIVARLIANLVGREPIILHEQASSGATLIEKLERYAAVAAFAVVIATGDDVGRIAGNDDAAEQPRARQNVILELGYFIALLGRQNVILLLEPGVERPSDTDGIVYARLDSSKDWQVELAKELEGAGFDVDRSAIK